MNVVKHPLTRDDYQLEGVDRIRVVSGERWGLFDRVGAWLEGDLHQCDPHMCIHLATTMAVRERQKARERAADE